MGSVVLLVEKILSLGEMSKDPERSIYLDVEEFQYMVHRAGSSIIQLWTRWIREARTSKEAVAQATNYEGLIISRYLSMTCPIWSRYTICGGISVSWWY